MSFAHKMPALAASIAVVGVLFSLPASAQAPNGLTAKIASNAAAHSSMMAMAQAGAAPAVRPSTTTESPGSATGNDMMAKAANQLK